uniref:CCHC-type domain-containing protein n=1 Tax=Daphnia galeata TaxID=27404 RepID=A0A8J2S8J6_9CRUS|nr:unnamed protein product [Daphnia galeata]
MNNNNEPLPTHGPKHDRSSQNTPSVPRAEAHTRRKDMGPPTEDLRRVPGHHKAPHRSRGHSPKPRVGRLHSSDKHGGISSSSHRQRTTIKKSGGRTVAKTTPRNRTTRAHNTTHRATKQQPRRGYTDGRPICFYCKEDGHIKRCCPKKKIDDETQSNTQRNTTVALMSTDDDECDKEIPLLKIDVAQLLVENVTIGKDGDEKEIEAVIDTGAAVSIVSPRIAVDLALELKTWGGPSIVMVNGQRTPEEEESNYH